MDPYNVVKPFKIVLLDDNFIIRLALKTLLRIFASEHKLNIQIFSSENGVEGLGFVYVLDPDLVIVDTTLPKYSGREVIDFLVSNEKYKDRQIILHDNSLPLNELQGFILTLSKHDSQFIFNLIGMVEDQYKKVFPGGVGKKVPSFKNRFRFFCIKRSVYWATIIDKIRSTEPVTSLGLARLLRRTIAGLSHIFTAFYMLMLRVLTPMADDENIDQQKKDLQNFRIKTYPALAFFITGIFLLTFQFGLYVSGSLLVLTNVDVEPILASEDLKTLDLLLNSNNIVSISSGVKYDNDLASIVMQKQSDSRDGSKYFSPYNPSANIKIEESCSLIRSLTIDWTTEKDLTFMQLRNITPELRLQLSNNGKDWYYFNENLVWQKDSYSILSTTSIEDANLHLDKFSQMTQCKTLYVRLFFVSDGQTNVKLSGFRVN